MNLYLFTQLDTIDEDFIKQCLSWFPEEQRKAILGTKHLQGKREKVVAYLLLCQLWEVMDNNDLEKSSDYISIEGISPELLQRIAHNVGQYNSTLLPKLKKDNHGKPHFVNYPTIHFNISHCRTVVCVAFSKRPVGIDVENIRSYKETLVQRVCSKKELQFLAESDMPNLEFTRLWTRKEAYLKWLGTGIVGIDILKQLPPTEANITTIPLPNGQGYISVCEELEISN